MARGFGVDRFCGGRSRLIETLSEAAFPPGRTRRAALPPLRAARLRFYRRRLNSLGLRPTVLRKLAAKDDGVW